MCMRHARDQTTAARAQLMSTGPACVPSVPHVHWRVLAGTVGRATCTSGRCRGDGPAHFARARHCSCCAVAVLAVRRSPHLSGLLSTACSPDARPGGRCTRRLALGSQGAHVRFSPHHALHFARRVGIAACAIRCPRCCHSHTRLMGNTSGGIRHAARRACPWQAKWHAQRVASATASRKVGQTRSAGCHFDRSPCCIPQSQRRVPAPSLLCYRTAYC